MWKIALLIWIMVGTTVAGIAFLIVLATPGLATQAARYAPYAIALGFCIGAYASWVVARKIAPNGLG
ncbi:MAG: hypothetical protein JNK46_09755 [Methylobacteriaceae bacterium]|nr:hypothetical protein [Methylobacteriaceae bacterium]